MGNLVTYNITKASRALPGMSTAFVVTCARAQSQGLQLSNGHAGGLTCSRIVEN